MKKVSLLFITIALFAYSCSNVPITGRRQLMLVSDADVLSLSLSQYNDYLKSAKKSTDAVATALVVKVGRRIADAVESYYRADGMEDMLKDYSWEFNLIEDASINAFCMPGGKIVVYTGILPVTKDEAGLAVVLSHEVAHAVAKHANERMSQQVLAQYGESALASILGGASDKTKQIGQTVFGLGAEYFVMLPFSRKQELEADHLGLVLMAIAGYNPESAIPFWQRMSQSGGAAVPEFMSTHPSDATRISDIQKELPEAKKVYDALWGNGSNTNSSNTSKPASTPKTNETWRF
jgi:predicted Zn-dependent protease